MREPAAPGPSRPAVAVVYGGALLSGLTVVSFPASSTVLRALHHLTDAEYGSIFLPQAGLTIVGSLVGGTLAARLGLKALHALSLLLFALAEACLCAVAFVPSSAALPVLLVGTGLMGLGFGLAAAPLNSYPGLLYPRRAEPALVALHTLLAFGFALGPLAVAALVDGGLWLAFPASIAALSAVAAVATLRLPLPAARAATGGTAPPTPCEAGVGSGDDAPPPALADPAASPPLVILALFGLLAVAYAIAEGTYSNWAAVYLHEDVGLSDTVAPLGITAFWVALALGRLGVSGLVARVPAEVVWLGLPVAMAAVFLLLPYASNAVTGIGLFLLAGLAASAFFPLTVAIASKRYPGREALVASLLTAALMLGVGGGTYLLGALRRALDFVTIYRLSAAYPAVALLLAILALALSRRAAAPAGSLEQGT
ncbi:MAG: sugar MFS transporter [Sandaracinaceae bacterium]